MKKFVIISVLALVVIGCVLAAGCTSTTTNGSSVSGSMTDILADSNAAVIVTNENELRDAVKAGGSVMLGADIKIGSSLNIENEVTLNLNGYDLKCNGKDRVIYINSTGNLTLNDNEQSYGPGRVKDGGNKNGGGVYVEKGGVFTMNAGYITANNGDDDGGGVYVNGGTFIMNGGLITENDADDYGGGVYITNGGKFTMNDGSISRNAAEWHDGGGVYLKDNCEFTMNGGTITKNCGDNDGGGVFVAGTFTMNDGEIGDNEADDQDGGGVFVTGCGTFIMNNGIIINNVCPDNGGGVYVKGKFTMNNGTIESNNADGKDTKENGGGVYVTSEGKFEMNDGLIYMNSARHGGGVYTNGIFTQNGGEIKHNFANSNWWDFIAKDEIGTGVYVEDDGKFIMNAGKVLDNSGVEIATEDLSRVILNGGNIKNDAVQEV